MLNMLWSACFSLLVSDRYHAGSASRILTHCGLFCALLLQL